jgi:predicted Rossmann fold nucleotide-binding protein DprA/Smf involved in DNA uptake
VAGIPQLLDDLGLPGAAGLPARPADASRGVSSSVAAASPGAVLTARAPGDEAVGRAVLAGAATVDELVAVTTLTVPAVLRSLTRLEAAGLVQARAGRYLPAGSLAA